MRQRNIRKLINTYSQHNRTKQQFHTELSKRWIDGSIFFMQLFHNFVWAHSTFMVVSVTCLFFLCRQSLVCMYPSFVLYVVLNNQNLMLIANSMLVINGADKVCVISKLESFVFIKCNLNNQKMVHELNNFYLIQFCSFLFIQHQFTAAALMYFIVWGKDSPILEQKPQ